MDSLATKILKCQKCGHEWLPKKKNSTPAMCPSCSSYEWADYICKSEEPNVMIDPMALEILEKLGRDRPTDDIVATRIAPNDPFPESYIAVWKERGIIVEPIGCIYVLYDTRPDAYTYPLNFNVSNR